MRSVALVERLIRALDIPASRFEAPLRARVDAGGTRTGELGDELRRLGAAEVELRQALSTVFARLGHDLDALAEKIVKALDLRDDAAPGLRAMIDQVRSEMVRGGETLLAASMNSGDV